MLDFHLQNGEVLTTCCFQPLRLWEFVTEAVENQRGAEPAPRWSLSSARVEISRARSLRQLARVVTTMGKPRRSPTQPGVVTKRLIWCGGRRGPGRPGKPRFALPTLSECPSPNLPHHARTHTHTHTHTLVSTQELWLHVTETTTGYHNRASSRGYGGLAEQSTQVRKPTAEKMVPRSRNERALWQGRAPPAG